MSFIGCNSILLDDFDDPFNVTVIFKQLYCMLHSDVQNFVHILISPVVVKFSYKNLSPGGEGRICQIFILMMYFLI